MRICRRVGTNHNLKNRKEKRKMKYGVGIDVSMNDDLTTNDDVPDDGKYTYF